MNTIPAEELTTFKMVEKNEKEFCRVILNDRIIYWTGIGWIDERPATKDDYNDFKVVK